VLRVHVRIVISDSVIDRLYLVGCAEFIVDCVGWVSVVITIRMVEIASLH